jgi:hypothetical protein
VGTHERFARTGKGYLIYYSLDWTVVIRIIYYDLIWALVNYVNLLVWALVN